MATPRYCPRCGEEYLATVSRCAHCGVELRASPPSESEPEGEPLPPSEDLAALRSADWRWARGLAEALGREGIPSRVELDAEQPDGGAGSIRCTVYVRRGDVERAARIDADFARTQVPDLPQEASAAWREAERCPACEAELAPDASECRECGLVFAPPSGEA